MKLIKTEKYYQELIEQLNRSLQIAKPYRRLCKIMGLSTREANCLTVLFVRNATNLDLSDIYYKKEESKQ